MKDAHDVATAPLTALGLIGGFLTAQQTGIRPLGGVVLAAAGGYAARTWYVKRGWPVAAALGLGYLGGFGLSHPLAKKIGAWPAVLTITAGVAAASYLAVDATDATDPFTTAPVEV